MERTGVLKPVDPEPFIDEEELLASAAENTAEIKRQPIDPEQQDFLRQECEQDEARGFAGPLQSEADMNTRFGPGR